MDELFKERKWYNITETLIKTYSSNIIDKNASKYIHKLLPLISNINPQRLPELFKLYLTKTEMPIEEKLKMIDNIINSLNNPLEKTSDHEKVILFFNILKTNFEMNIKDVQTQVYLFKEKDIFSNMNNNDVVKRELNELLLKYFEMVKNLKEASYYAKIMGYNDKYILYTLYSDEINRIDIKITDKILLEDYKRMLNGDFNYFKSKEKEILKLKSMKYFILKKCYMIEKINIKELSKEMGIKYTEILNIIINLLTSELIEGFVDENELIIHGTLGVSKLENLKQQYEEWISRIKMVRDNLK